MDEEKEVEPRFRQTKTRLRTILNSPSTREKHFLENVKATASVGVVSVFDIFHSSSIYTRVGPRFPSVTPPERLDWGV